MSFVAALLQDVCKAPCCAPPGWRRPLAALPRMCPGPFAALLRMCPGPFAGLPRMAQGPSLRSPGMCPGPFARLPGCAQSPSLRSPGCARGPLLRSLSTTKLNQERGSRAMAKKGEGAPWNRGGAVAEFGGRRITGQLQSARFRRGRLWGGGRLRRWSGPAG